MSKMNPDLKRLLKWGCDARPSRLEEAPFGFSTRVLAARGQPRLPTLLEELQEIGWGLTCVAVAMIACGSLVLLSRLSGPASMADLPSAVSYLASNLPL